MKKKTVAFYTLGCKVNQYETNAMKQKFIEKDYEIVDFEEAADIYVVNTCTVTNMSDRKSRQIIRRAKESNKNSLLVVTGCYAQVAKDELEKIEEEPLFEEEAFESHVLYKFKKEQPFTITRENDIYVVKGERVEKLFKMTKFTDEGAVRFARKLRAMGIDEKLLEMGAKYGDMVQIMDLIFEFKE